MGETDGDISTDFRELGINGSWRALPDLQLSMQVVYRDAGETDESGFRIDYGLANYSFFSSENSLLGVRAGRVPTPLGFYNETRDVASTRPGIFLPQSIYFDINRNLALSADGGYLYGEHRTDYGDISFDVGVVIPRTDDPDFKNLIAGQLPGEVIGDASWVTRLNYEWQGGRVRAAITYIDFNAHYAPDPGTFNLSPGSFKFNPWFFSAQYNAERWSLTAEYAIRRLRFTDFGLFPDIDITGQSFYIQGSYQITSYLEALIRYDDYIVNNKDKKGEKFAAATGLPAYSRFAQDWTFGLRLEPYPNFLISAEYHRVNGTGWLSPLENPVGTTKQHWDLYSLLLSYDF